MLSDKGLASRVRKNISQNSTIRKQPNLKKKKWGKDLNACKEGSKQKMINKNMKICSISYSQEIKTTMI